MILVFNALAHEELGLDRGPIAYALTVSGQITRNDGTYLDAGEAIEPGARLEIPAGAAAVVAHAGRLERWEGPGRVVVDEHAVHIRLGSVSVRRGHVEDQNGGLTGRLRVPAGREQMASVLGIPTSESSWGRQDEVDGGALHALYRDTLRARLATAQVPPGVVSGLGLADSLPGDVNEQTSLVGAYLDLAAATPNSVLLLELPPTNPAQEAVDGHVMGHVGDVLAAGGPHTFRMDERTDRLRVYGRMAADAMRARGASAGGPPPNVFALMVPYANIPENTLLRLGRPKDGAEVLHQVLGRAGGQRCAVPTLALGYGQGAAVVREYLAKYGDSDGLDFAVSIATNGGVDGNGGDGVWAGRLGPIVRQGVTTVAVVHARDPARRLYGRSLFALAAALDNLRKGGKGRGGDTQLHQGYYGSRLLPAGVDPVRALAAGTYGYPIAYLRPLLDAQLAGRLETRFVRLGAWDWDLRLELTEALNGDFSTWRTAPRDVAAGYLPK